MPVAGVDFAWGQPSDTALDQAGVKFVCRYLCSDQYASKRITQSEAAWHLSCGRDIVLVWEDTAARMLGGYAAGQADARAADAQCTRFGLPGCPVYYAADWDATPGQQAAIDAYLDGAASVTGLARVGLYGGYWPVSRARAAGKAAYLWGTRAWSGTMWATCGWKPHIMQGTTTTIGGVSCDWDTAWYPDFGQWRGGDWTEEAIMALPTLTLGAQDQPGAMLMVHRVQVLAAGIGAWNNLGAATQCTADGKFGPETAEAVKAIQRFFGITEDSVVGKQTWGCLIKGSPS